MNWAEATMFWTLVWSTCVSLFCAYFSLALVLLYAMFFIGGWFFLPLGIIMTVICVVSARRMTYGMFDFSKWFVKLGGMFK